MANVFYSRLLACKAFDLLVNRLSASHFINLSAPNRSSVCTNKPFICAIRNRNALTKNRPRELTL